MKNKKENTSTIILVIIFFIGIFVLLYPIVSNWYNRLGVKKAIENYNESVKEFDPEDVTRILNDAELYNKNLYENPKTFHNGEPQDSEYKKLLDPTGTGMMGYITISKLGVELPIYHGTTNDVLKKAIGHLEGSSLPIGGQNTHAVLTGHRGLPTAKLFTNLNKLEDGDIFVLNILNQKLTYEVDDIKTVLPEEVNNLEIIKDNDYVTLITCTPYAVNTHRLLVRGKRIENLENIIIQSDAIEINYTIVALVIAIIILIILAIIVFIKPGKKEKTHKKWSEIKNDKK